MVLPRPHKSAATPAPLGALIYENASLQVVEHLVADRYDSMSDARQKAVDLGPRAVQSMWEKGKQTLLDGLDFRGFPQKYGFDLINNIYPKDVKFGKLDPTG